MLEILQQVVQKVSEAENVKSALSTIVLNVKKAVNVDQCSIFLLNPDKNILVLSAASGLDRSAIGMVKLVPGEGLVGYVAEQRRPVIVENASSHPRFKSFPLIAEERYKAFLGVPVVHLRKVVGVLVVQTIGNRQFNDEDEAFLVTISAQLAGFVHGASIVQQLDIDKPQHNQVRIQGIAGASGVATGTAVLASPFADLAQVDDRVDSDPDVEVSRFKQAITAVTAELSESIERLEEAVPDEVLNLFSAYIQIANDDMIVVKTISKIIAGQWAPAALRDTIAEISNQFEQIQDERLKARSEDIRAVGRRILLRLHPDVRESSDYPERCILVGREVSVARISQIPKEKLAGILCFEGSALSHTAILAKSLDIPAVMGLGKIPPESLTSGLIVVDGYQGKVIVNPIAPVLAEYNRLEQEELELSLRLHKDEHLPSKTHDDKAISVFANISMSSDVEMAIKVKAVGIGLYRSEFPFMLRESFPVEEKQVEIYRQVLKAIHPKPVVMRTLDIGADKPLPYFPLDAINPALGLRGIRISLNHAEIFITQIRAMLRANVGLDNLSILLPLVSAVSEVQEARALIRQAISDLASEGLEVKEPLIGVMIEVPSLLFQIHTVSQAVDFFSIGTNDLTQYLMAADRDNAQVSDLYDHMQPSVLLAIKYIISQLSQTGKKLTVCGELASDPGGVLLLLSMGIDAFSISTSAFAKVKWVIRSFDAEMGHDLLTEALIQKDAAGVRALTNRTLENIGLGGLVRAGK